MDDLIRRQDAIEELRDVIVKDVQFGDELTDGYNDGIDMAITVISKLPSAEPKTGEWVWSDEDASWTCGCCDCVFEEIDWKPDYNYCPNCGARMKGGDDEV